MPPPIVCQVTSMRSGCAGCITGVHQSETGGAFSVRRDGRGDARLGRDDGPDGALCPSRALALLLGESRDHGPTSSQRPGTIPSHALRSLVVAGYGPDTRERTRGAPMPATLAVDDVAQLLGLHPRTVRRRAADGKIPAVRDDLGSWWFDPETIHAFRRQQQADKAARQEAAAQVERLEQAAAVPEWLTTEEAARILRIGVRTVRKHLAAGTLPGRDFGGVWRVHRSGVEPPTTR
ncbi:hypothetical protein DNK55_20510 [Streptomyces sp. AC1-42T]|nr:hypothetical protein DNK55_20510 [Streptomyces sp. AC1-42T]